MYAQQLADTGQAEQAIASMNAQLDRINGKGGPEERDAQLSAANIDFRLHRTSDAMEHLAKAEALAKTPDERINVDLLRATILDRDKQFEAAEAEYKKALAPRSQQLEYPERLRLHARRPRRSPSRRSQDDPEIGRS